MLAQTGCRAHRQSCVHDIVQTPFDVPKTDAERNAEIDTALHLQGLSLNIPAGTSCALVGTSGSGKSTVLRLLFRFYEPESGALTVAGRDITDYTMKSLRAKIGEVSLHQQRCCMLKLLCVVTGFAEGLRLNRAAHLPLSAQHRGIQIGQLAMKLHMEALAGFRCFVSLAGMLGDQRQHRPAWHAMGASI